MFYTRYVIFILKSDKIKMEDLNSNKKSNSKQLTIVKKKARFSKDHNTTFRQNKQKPIHQWYSYVEGFSWISFS